MNKQLRDIEALCLDFDGVFYLPHDIPNIHTNFAVMHAHTASELFVGKLDFNDALTIASEGYNLIWRLYNGTNPMGARPWHLPRRFSATFF